MKVSTAEPDEDQNRESITEFEAYDRKNLNSELDEIDRMDWRIKIRKIGFLVFISLLGLLILYGIILMVVSGSPSDKTDKKPENKPANNTSHKQDFEWVNDANGNKYQVLGQYSRKSTHYTQGLYLGDGVMVESGGLYGQSTLQFLEVDEQGKFINVAKQVNVPSNYFAEGCDVITVDNVKYIYQLTWKENKIFKYDMNLKLIKEFDKPIQLKEGWGITHNPSNQCSLIISDSSSTLHKVNCLSMEVTESIPVTKNNNPLYSMNELEFAEDYLLANVYLSKDVYIIDLKTGKVVRTLDLSALLQRANEERTKRGLYSLGYDECLNGIAYDWQNKHLWITGKNWPLFFKIKLPDEYLKSSV